MDVCTHIHICPSVYVCLSICLFVPPYVRNVAGRYYVHVCPDSLVRLYKFAFTQMYIDINIRMCVTR